MNQGAGATPAAGRHDEPLSAELTRLVSAFARTCRAAARAIALYPAEHPAAASALTQVVEAARAAAADTEIRLTVFPDTLAVDGRRPARADAAVGELAALLHAHQVGQLAISPQSDDGDWRRFLSLLGLPPDQTRQRGGLAALWASEGQTRIAARQIDYSGLLRERISGERATWEAIVRECLEDDAHACDDWMLDLVLEILDGPEQIDRLLEAVAERAPQDGARGPLMVAGLLQAVAQFVARTQPDQLEPVLASMAHTTATMPLTTLAPIASARSDIRRPELAKFIGALAKRMTDASLADRVVQEYRGRTSPPGLIGETISNLVPDVDRRSSILSLARHALEHAPGLAAAPTRSQDHVEQLLAGHDDRPFVSDAYAVELQRAAERAIDLDRDPTDPGPRIAEWTSTVSEDQVRRLDAQLLVDLMQMKRDVSVWREVASLAVARTHVLVVLGDFHAASFLVGSLRRQQADHPVPEIREAAQHVTAEILSPDLMRHVASHLDTTDATVVESGKQFCQALGTAVIPRLAETLSREERERPRRHLIDILTGFGAPGRQAVERLMKSSSAAVRRTAVQLLQEFGGHDALPELESLLNDEESHVQREATRAIAQLGVEAAYESLTQALTRGSDRSREAITTVLWSLPSEESAPLLAYLVTHADLGGSMWLVHERAVRRLGTVGGPVAVQALGEVMERGRFFAPVRTAALRRQAAEALARIGTSNAVALLKAAAADGPWGVRRAARAALASGAPPPADG